MSLLKNVLIILSCLFVTSCITAPPHNVDDICKIFNQYPRWYADSAASQSKWHVPISVQMAIIHQESRFNGSARPERTKLLWIIPWTRPSTAYGYTQALRGTWARYKKQNGGVLSSRDDFADGVDFVGWYANLAHRKAGISKNDAYSLYLAYHEGIGGYERKTYLRKKWLMAVARKVKARSEIYRVQLARCEGSLKRRSWYKFW